MVGAIRVAPMTAAAAVTQLSGNAVTGNPTAIALAQNAKRPQFTRSNQDWAFLILQLGAYFPYNFDVNFFF